MGRWGRWALVWDAGQNAVQAGRGGYDIYENGLTWTNGLQVVGSLLGLGGNYTTWRRLPAGGASARTSAAAPSTPTTRAAVSTETAAARPPTTAPNTPTTRAAAADEAATGAAPARTPADILMPGGSRIGRPGTSSGIRRVNGGLPEAERLFEELAAGGRDITPSGHPGRLVELPGGGRVGLRPVSSSADASPAIDVDIPGIPVRKIHFEP
jgi:hypothetical protein